jgi:hypothetical protein
MQALPPGLPIAIFRKDPDEPQDGGTAMLVVPVT